uniref:GNAT family N-acetyltransferase n=1 Tax=Nonomuraea pusilla TaxID=46177 RepID=UPI001F311D9C|nr:GNAT family N-acetyltransferase [Nonomuraea pusilla]
MTKAEADIRPQEPATATATATATAMATATATATRPEGRVRPREWRVGDAAVVLREWRVGDAAVVLRAFQGDDLRDQASWPIVTLKDAEGWIASWRGAGHAFAVTDMTRGGLVVGNVAVTPVVPAFEGPSEAGAVAGTPGAPFQGGAGMVSYWVVPEARGRGVATAAVLALVRWAFGERGMRRLELEHRTDNPASCRVATRAGFVADGVERGRLLRDGVRRDIEHHTLLAAAA